ncbi:hypothetical protein AKJ65_01255 [candidate division MSBL1 archaeon SCGC-AAA259E19]|uniref:Methenyltetrahydromethanopterin cyclohydrolase n=1 Tax=candidate division MSBL1 archaeon SCGC-AAA259E19 TaxID=1698264 RepID=A0A133UN97_9EURY|nr:hypothetical protein AKJ65_01255 [candidate division MSBL1 archaeon SCGC-AAA259E19]
MLSVNDKALTLVKKMIENDEDLGVSVFSLDNGTSVIDAGVKSRGGYRAGKLLSEICLGGLGAVSILMQNRPRIHVQVDHAPVSCLGSQYTGWSRKLGCES